MSAAAEGGPGRRRDFATREAYAQALRLRAPMSRWRPDEDRLWRFAGRVDERPWDCMVKMGLSLPEEWWPADDQSMYGARDFAHYCEPLAELLGHYDFLSGCKGRWREYQARFSHEAGVNLTTGLADAVDMVKSFEVQVVVPAMRRLGIHGGPVTSPFDLALSRCVAARLLVGTKALQRILEQSDLWHRLQERIEAMVVPDFPSRFRWPVPFPDLVVPWDGLPRDHALRIVGLARPSELRAEGTREWRDGVEGLGHCVGGYGRRCASGQSSILSVRLDRPGDGFMRFSTMEVTFGRDGSLQVLQHRARGNGEPKGVSIMAEEWLLAAYAQGVVQRTPQFLAHEWPSASDMDRFDYDWARDEAFASAVAAWAPLLPRDMREPAALERATAREAYAIVAARYPQGLGALWGGFMPPATVPAWGGKPPEGVGGPSAFAAPFAAPRLARDIALARLPPLRRRGYLQGSVPSAIQLFVTFCLAAVGVSAFDVVRDVAATAGADAGAALASGLAAAVAAYALAGVAALPVMTRLGEGLRRDLSGGTVPGAAP